ncbi:sigma-70 family RNA polymerase sigma factor [Baekduia soli]|uniref:Sigma-70 family RNA polymerase sigma factor n=1 Tax=Baekduia soli TaxID=496014 RepID=A0A5B8U5J5_9ACTN|nr:sigma-70 family RNA polymerase sigma factor [Baekduia soli]QEC48211.1 sigma-70 family RNA polymerase sigma factor [Baekduia soli]
MRELEGAQEPATLEADVRTQSVGAVTGPSVGHGSGADAALLARYARTRSPQVREQLVHRYLPLARHAAGQYAAGAEPFDDLLQVASIGLLKAIDRFDPDRGIAFSSFALPTMAGEIRRHFRDRGWAIRPPRDLLELALSLEREAEELQRVLGRSPTVAELSRAAGRDEETVLEARQALSAKTFASLSAPSGGEHGGGETILERGHGVEETGYERAEQRATLAPLVGRLPAREQLIVRLRFDRDLTQAEIGEIVGLSQMHVSRILRTSLQRLQTTAPEPWVPAPVARAPRAGPGSSVAGRPARARMVGSAADTVRILDDDTELTSGLDAGTVAGLGGGVEVRRRRIRRGPWTPPLADLCEVGHLGLLVLDGFWSESCGWPGAGAPSCWGPVICCVIQTSPTTAVRWIPGPTGTP